MKVTFKGWQCVAVKGYYGNKRKAISLIDEETHEPIATASINVVAAECGEDEMFVKDYSENEGMADSLIKAGIIEPRFCQNVQSGHVRIKSYLLTEKAMDKLFNE